MAFQEMQKQLGCTFIEFDGLVHEFSAAWCSDSQLDSIHERAVGINKL